MAFVPVTECRWGTYEIMDGRNHINKGVLLKIHFFLHTKYIYRMQDFVNFVQHKLVKKKNYTTKTTLKWFGLTLIMCKTNICKKSAFVVAYNLEVCRKMHFKSKLRVIRCLPSEGCVSFIRYLLRRITLLCVIIAGLYTETTNRGYKYPINLEQKSISVYCVS